MGNLMTATPEYFPNQGNINQPLTMSSQEIAELTGKRHADVMRDIRNTLSKLDLNERSFASVYIDGKGESRPCFNLKYLYRRGGSLRVYAHFQHLFYESFNERTGRADIFCTPEGKAELSRLYEEDKLTMKVLYQR